MSNVKSDFKSQLINEYSDRLIKLKRKYYTDVLTKDTLSIDIINTDLIETFVSLKQKSNNLKSRYSLDFNYFKYFKLDEKKHSEILADLLNPNGKHGQSDLFLNSVLKIDEIISKTKL